MDISKLSKDQKSALKMLLEQQKNKLSITLFLQLDNLRWKERIFLEN